MTKSRDSDNSRGTNDKLVDILVDTSMAKSRSEARRLISQGAVKLVVGKSKSYKFNE